MATTIPDLLQVLFSTFPPQHGDTDAQLTAYALALEGRDPQDIETAVRRFIRGEVDGHTKSFAPSSALLGAEVRRCLDVRLDAINRDRRLRPHLPPPDIEKTPEQRARALQRARDFAESVAAADLHETTEATKRQRERWAKVNARFAPEMTERAVMERLLGYSTGSPESEREAS